MLHSMADWPDSPLDRTDQILLEMHFMHLGFFYLWDALMVGAKAPSPPSQKTDHHASKTKG